MEWNEERERERERGLKPIYFGDKVLLIGNCLVHFC